MRVGIDATYLLTVHRSGVETYVLNLLRALLPLPDRPQVFLYAAGKSLPDDAAALLKMADRVRLSRIRRLWLRARMPLWMGWDRVCVAHLPGTILPPWLPCPAVTTFYDLGALHYPHLYEPRELALYEQVIPASAHRSAAIIAISQTTKADLVNHMGVPPQKILVTPLGVDGRFAPVPEALSLVTRRWNLRQPYILACVGSGHPRKNLRGVVQAFDELGRADLQLAIVGTVSRDPGACAAIARSPWRDRIALLGHVPEDELPAIYSAATVFCFASLYEGFGLPVLEAMACGTPVVCSNIASLAEVAKDAAVLVDPHAPGALTEALGAVLEDESRRGKMAAAGLARAAQFTWERTARGTLDAYAQAVTDPAPTT